MKNRSGQARNRRELFTEALRYAALAFLAAGGPALYAKRRRLRRDGVCIHDGLCGGCAVSRASCPRFEGGTPSTRCGLPAAVLARKARVGVNRGGR